VRERERERKSQQECEILTNMRFSRMWERLENFSRRKLDYHKCEVLKHVRERLKNSQQKCEVLKHVRERVKNSQQKCEVFKNERKTGKILNKNVRFSQMWGSQECEKDWNISQQECEILTNVRFSRMWEREWKILDKNVRFSRMCVCEREREKGNFFSQEFFAIVDVCKESQKRSFCNNNSFTCNAGTQYSNTHHWTFIHCKTLACQDYGIDTIFVA
jgi:hypothetical protein